MPNVQVMRLQERLRAIEGATLSRRGAEAIPLAEPGLLALFPNKRLCASMLIELLAETHGGGAWTIAFCLARQACAAGKGLVVVDSEGSFYPPSAALWGIDLDRMLLVRPGSPRDALAAMAQSLRSAAVGAAVGVFGPIASTDYRRLQLAAETGGSLGLLLRAAEQRHAPSFAAVRLAVRPQPSSKGKRRFQVETVRMRGDSEGRTTILEWDDEAHSLRASAAVAVAAAAASRTAAEG